MDGLMMQYELTLPKILMRARQMFAHTEIVSQFPGRRHRYTYADLYDRVVRLMNVLRGLGVKRGDRVATFAWNSYRHMELYFAIPAIGAVLHTLNVRLSRGQLEYIVNHAEDSYLFADTSLLEPLENLRNSIPTVRGFVLMDDLDKPQRTSLAPVHDYEQLMAHAGETPDFPELRESEACGLCYTSGTTGNPKGVLYSHRAIYLHSLMAGLPETMGVRGSDAVMPVVPMFHANAWGVPYTGALVGAKIVYTGSDMSPENVTNLLASEHVTLAMGVPTIWNGVLEHLRGNNLQLPELERMLVGGSAVPLSLIEAYRTEFDVEILQGWGMTELSPMGTTARLTRKMLDWSPRRQAEMRAKAGMAGPNLEMKIVDDSGREMPWDGVSFGELLVRGPCIARAYYNNPEGASAFTGDGWFRTGDVAAIDEHGALQISDRTKDLIKSGGEWISSVGMENAIMAHPDVLEAAVVARPDAKWDERPVAFVVRKNENGRPEPGEIVALLGSSFAKWQLPATEDIRFIEEVPKTSVGKFDKKVLRNSVRVE